MRQYLTGSTVANEARMRRTRHRGALMLVEGDRDARVFRRVVQARCIVIAHSRANALDARRQLMGLPGVLAVIDADFDRLEGMGPSDPDVFRTDGHDLEAMVFASDAPRRVVELRGSAAKHAAHGVEAESLVALLLPAASALGRLRWWSHRAGAGRKLTFQGLKFDKRWLGLDRLEVDQPRLVELLIARSHSSATLAEIIAGAAALEPMSDDPLDLCCGHDMAALLGCALRKMLGNLNARDADPARIEDDLMLAWDVAEIRSTRLYGALVGWSHAHPDWSLLVPTD